jgi:hypothetical protein
MNIRTVGKNLRSGQVLWRVWYNQFTESHYVEKIAPIGRKVLVSFKPQVINSAINHTIEPAYAWQPKNNKNRLGQKFVPLSINQRYFNKKKQAEKFVQELNEGRAEWDEFTQTYFSI